MIKSRLVSKCLFNVMTISKAKVRQAYASCFITRNCENNRCFQTASLLYIRDLDRINVLKLSRMDPDPRGNEDKQFLITLQSLYSAAKQNNLDIKNEKDLRELFELIYHNIRKLNTNELVTVFNILSYFRIPAGTMIMQRTLQMIRTNINDMSPRQIILVHRLLLRSDRTPLGDAVMTSLPIVFQQTIKHQLLGEDIELLTSALVYALQNDLPDSSVYKIKQLIEVDISQLTLKAAENIVIAMEYKSKHFCKPITYEALRIIAKTKNVPYEDVKKRLQLLFPRQVDSKLYFGVANK